MVPLFYLLIIAFLATGLGKRLLLWLGVSFSSFAEEFIFCVAVGLGFLSYMLFAFGMAGFLHNYLIYAALGLIALFCRQELLFFVHRFWSINLSTVLYAKYANLLLVAAIGLAVFLNFIGTLAPISSADALHYHMAAPKYYMWEQQIVQMPWKWHTYQPFNIEILFLLGLILWSDILGALFHFLFGVLIVLAILPFCRRYFPRANSLLAAAIFYIGGLVVWESTSSFIDLGLTLFVFLSFFAFLNWLTEEGEEWLLLSGILGGLAAGSKLNGAVFPAITLLLLVGYLLSKKRLTIKPLVSFSLPVLLLVAPWYLRNYFWIGNPVYPFLSGLFGTPDFSASLSSIATRYGYGKDLVALLLAPFNLTFRGTAFDYGQLIGPLYLSFLPLSFLVSPERRIVRLLWIFSALYFVVWFYTSQQARFLLPILPLLAVVSSSAAIALLRMERAVKLVTASVLIVGIGFGIAITAYYNAQFFRVVFGLESRDDFLARMTWYYEDIRWMNENLPPNAKVLLMTDGMPYYLDREYEIGSLEGALAKNGGSLQFDYLFCTRNCEIQLPGIEVIRESQTSLVGSRTFQRSLRQVKTYVLRLPKAATDSVD